MSGWHQLAFGSVAEKVVRLSPFPVLVLRARPENKSSDASPTRDSAVVAR
jgi:hypothetical protein